MVKHEKMGHTQRLDAQQEGKQSRRLVSILIGVALFAGFVFILWQQTVSSPSLSATAVPDPVLGSADAPIEIVEYSDLAARPAGPGTTRGYLPNWKQPTGRKYASSGRIFPSSPPIHPKPPRRAIAQPARANSGNTTTISLNPPQT